jgi:hypothetical protein
MMKPRKLRERKKKKKKSRRENGRRKRNRRRLQTEVNLCRVPPCLGHLGK